ncbi:vitamin H transporter [Massarina eburnea CBS 473.64]|uniref:Vitamin H transporter n=1 Tax=Massarina eburnea CBS 473.64 TaxID=1395130 RepID=A0A6A6S085_9PLEO|nr:vitamin H transporter [Massarina eburnea CBS 473.64]
MASHAGVPRQKWWKIQWFAADDTHEERKFITKLDLILVPYLFVSYWVKNLDQNNLNNAYVAGMKEELGFYGNELIQLQTMYIIGAVVGQIPFLFIFTYIPMYWLVPGMDILWGVCTLLQYRANSFAEMAAYRFLVGWFEAAYFPACHYILGSWYRGHEIGRRGGMWYAGLPLGTLTAGLVQAGATRTLDGVNGLSGWRWMYIICAIITIPVGIVGYFIIPGTIDRPNPYILSEHDLNIARSRLDRNGHKMQGKLRLHHVKSIMSSKHFWIVVMVDVLFWNSGINSGAFLLWLKSLNRYDSATLNEYGVIPPAMGIFFTLFANFSSDLLWGPVWGITFASGMNSLTNLILTIWNVPEGAKWFAYCNFGWSYALSSVLHGWVNNILRDSPEMRSFTLVFINIMAQSSTAWTNILTFPTKEAPRFPKGYAFSLSMSTSLIVGAHVLNFYLKHRKESKEIPEVATPISEGVGGENRVGGQGVSKGFDNTKVTPVSSSLG